MAPKGFLTSSNPEKKKKKKTDYGFDWFEASIHGGSLMLSVIKEAAGFTPIPYLKEAAGTTLKIIGTVQAVKDNKADFHRLAEDSAGIINAIWVAFLKTEDPNNWPGKRLEDVIQEICLTLESVYEFVAAQVDRNRTVRIIYSVADLGKIKEYRERLQQAVNKFEISSHLEIHETLGQMKKMMVVQKEINEKHEEEAEEKKKEREELELDIAISKRQEEKRKHEEEQRIIEAENRIAREQEADRKRLEEEIQKMREEKRAKEAAEEAAEQKRRLRLKYLMEEEDDLRRRQQEEEERKKKLEKEMVMQEALERMRAKERAFFEEQERRRVPSPLPPSHQPRVESEDDDSSDDSSDDSEDERTHAEAERIRLEAEKARREAEKARQEAEEKAARRAARRARKEAEKTAAPTSAVPSPVPSPVPTPAVPSSDDLLRAEFARLGINPALVGSPSPQQQHIPPNQSPPFSGMYSPPYPPPGGAYSPYPYHHSPYFGSSPFGSPPLMPSMFGGYGAPGSTLTSPGGVTIQNHNSGNISGVNISNVNNDNSVRVTRKKGSGRR